MKRKALRPTILSRKRISAGSILRQRRWQEAERAFRRALDVDPDLADAHFGLSVALPRQNLVEQGIDHALLAVGLRHEFPEAHFQLGALLSRLGWFERAVQAFEMSLRLRPGFVLAHRYLARIYGRIRGRTWPERTARKPPVFWKCACRSQSQIKGL